MRHLILLSSLVITGSAFAATETHTCKNGALTRRVELTAEEKAREAIMLALRLMEGLNIDAFEHRFEMSLRDLAAADSALHAPGMGQTPLVARSG